MCGRKTLTRDIQSIIEEMAIEEWQDQDLFSPSYNIAPTQFSPIMVDHMGRRVKPMKWGLIPNWAKDKSIGSKLDDKLKSGEIKESELMQEAADLMEKMK